MQILEEDEAIPDAYPTIMSRFRPRPTHSVKTIPRRIESYIRRRQRAMWSGSLSGEFVPPLKPAVVTVEVRSSGANV